MIAEIIVCKECKDGVVDYDGNSFVCNNCGYEPDIGMDSDVIKVNVEFDLVGGDLEPLEIIELKASIEAT